MKFTILTLSLLFGSMAYSTSTLEERIENLEKRLSSLESKIFKKAPGVFYKCSCNFKNYNKYSLDISSFSYRNKTDSFSAATYMSIQECSENLKAHIACKK